jgi:hypothetical protein
MCHMRRRIHVSYEDTPLREYRYSRISQGVVLSDLHSLLDCHKTSLSLSLSPTPPPPPLSLSLRYCRRNRSLQFHYFKLLNTECASAPQPPLTGQIIIISSKSNEVAERDRATRARGLKRACM